MAQKTLTVDSYLDSYTGEARVRLDTIRKLVKKLVPEAVELFSYGLVGYKYKKKPLVYFGGFEHHTGFYATPNGHEAFKEDFAPYKQGKGSVQFPLDRPLPIELIEKVIRYRKQFLDS